MTLVTCTPYGINDHRLLVHGLRSERKMPEYETQEIENVRFTEFASLFDNVDNISGAYKSPMPLSMEELDFGFGYVLYSAYLTGPCDGNEYTLYIDGLRDRATIYLDGKYKGCYMRDGEDEPVKIVIPEGGAKLDIFVENMGRINYGRWVTHGFNQFQISDAVKVQLHIFLRFNHLNLTQIFEVGFLCFGKEHQKSSETAHSISLLEQPLTTTACALILGILTNLLVNKARKTDKLD